MVEPNRRGSDTGYWQYFIKPDKSATQQFEDLCLGLAQAICDLDPAPPRDRLTPQRLAAFYNSVGGNLDPIFLRTSESGLSFLYRTIGCFHSLEPTRNPFETPATPCLTPEGFVKWQTVQLLLCPEEHVGYLQEAVRMYNVPRPDGGFFPKNIPHEVFPDKPDAEMEAWHKHVTSQLNQENYMRRLKNSPYHSPYPTERVDGYFSGQPIPKIRRPSKPSRQDSRDENIRSPYSRRSSEPDFGPPNNPVDHARNPHAYSGNSQNRSKSPRRPDVGSRQRSATTGHSVRMNTSKPTSRNSDGRPPSSFYRGQYPERPERRGRDRDRPSPSGSSIGESSADDASSEDSRGQKRSMSSRAVSTLLSVLPFRSSPSRRSRSHDASAYRKERPSPRRERDDRGTPPPLRASTETFRPSPSVRFRHDMFDNPAAASAPEAPPRNQRASSGHRPDPRSPRNPGLTDPVSPVNYNLTREASSGSGSERRSAYEIPARQQRRAGVSPHPSNVATGVHGRRYANMEHPANGPPQQDPRTRYSLAV